MAKRPPDAEPDHRRDAHQLLVDQFRKRDPHVAARALDEHLARNEELAHTALSRAVGGAVIPTFNESANVAESVTRLADAVPERVPCEVIFVDDSTDDTPAVITDIARQSCLAMSVRHREVVGAAFSQCAPHRSTSTCSGRPATRSCLSWSCAVGSGGSPKCRINFRTDLPESRRRTSAKGYDSCVI